jgi:hypothetical protein
MEALNHLRRLVTNIQFDIYYKDKNQVWRPLSDQVWTQMKSQIDSPVGEFWVQILDKISEEINGSI